MRRVVGRARDGGLSQAHEDCREGSDEVLVINSHGWPSPNACALQGRRCVLRDESIARTVALLCHGDRPRVAVAGALLLDPCPVLVPPGFAQMTTLDFRRSVYPDTRDAAVADAEPAEA